MVRRSCQRLCNIIRPRPRAILAFLVIIVVIIPFQFNISQWISHLSRRPRYSGVHCSNRGYNITRATVCVYTDLYYSAKRGFLYVADNLADFALPPASTLGSQDWLQEWYTPELISLEQLRHLSDEIQVHHETAYAFGTLAGGHMTHFVINALMPLADIMMYYPPIQHMNGALQDWLGPGATPHAVVFVQPNYWGMQPAVFAQKDADMHHHMEYFLTQPLGIPFFSRVYPNDTAADIGLHLFPRVVVGLAGSCGWPHLCDHAPDAAAVQVVARAIKRKHVPHCHVQRSPSPFVLVIQRYGHREMLNFELMEQMLDRDSARMGYEYLISTLDGMDHQQRAELFCRASVVVGVHGNALGNIIFMAPNTSVIELHPYFLDNQYPIQHFEWPCKLLGLDYQLVACRDFSCGAPDQMAPNWYALARDLVLTDAFIAELSASMLHAVQLQLAQLGVLQ
eukprot:TRINITY_DN8462_c0_g1_i1.p1 TRINITY_DN8462_c0_g1~~TRINITY_DN8462_c0_g1_i1.p1  ORF type:complete len:452 (-),score=59.88 TRINITY_DN8462_c0_g1_i1:26-1381(-)